MYKNVNANADLNILETKICGESHVRFGSFGEGKKDGGWGKNGGITCGFKDKVM